MIIYQIRLPRKQNTEAFVKFMQEEYFPAVHMGPTRIGKVTDLRLLKRQNEIEGDDVGLEFVWHVGWNGQPTGKVSVDDEEVIRKFQSFKARVKRIGSYMEVAALT